jgi:hypothetical protein
LAENAKRFRVAIVREDDHIGVGMELYNEKDLTWFGSFYLNKADYSRRDICQFYIARARKHLEPGEIAKIKVYDSLVKFHWHSHYPDVIVYKQRFGRFPRVHNLAVDAKNRKTTITEFLEGGEEGGDED